MNAHSETVMTAGRELDALIAEKVMGFLWHKWTPEMDQDAAADLRGHRFLKPADTIQKFRDGGWEVGPWVLASIDDPIYVGCDNQEIPNYTTDIAAAWLVVGELARRGYWLSLKSPFETDNAWSAGFTPHGMSGWNGRPDFAGFALTAPLAICLAALKAVAAVSHGGMSA